MYKTPLFILILCITSVTAYAELLPPQLHVQNEGRQVTLQWTAPGNAQGYRLFYAAYPFQGVESIHSIDMQAETDFSIELSQGDAFYVAVQAYDSTLEHSDYSNIGFILIQERGEQYRSFWRTVTKEISEQAFISDDFLYLQLPDVNHCSAGLISTAAQFRQLDTFNEIRSLHNLSRVSYIHNAGEEAQQAALIQRANNYLSHTPAENALCYSQTGYAGSSSSNLHLGSDNSDPADNLIGFIDDAFNISTIAGVGHRRALLNPFLQFTSYGQVFGASAVKVFDFSSSATTDASEIPDFVAFPYLRYPYIFFSDKSSDKVTPWSFTLIEDKSSLWANKSRYFEDIELTVTQKDSGRQLQVNNIHSDTKGSGVPNNLSWTVSDWQYDTWYTVNIDNIHYRSGETAHVHYDIFIDYLNIIDITAPLENGDQQNNLSMQGSLFNDNDIDSYEITLEDSGNVTFSGSSQFSNMGFFIAVYDANKQLLAAKDEPFTLDLNAGRYTLVISNCNQHACYAQAKNYTVSVNP